jgi:hypothetical protein
MSIPLWLGLLVMVAVLLAGTILLFWTDRKMSEWQYRGEGERHLPPDPRVPRDWAEDSSDPDRSANTDDH